MKKIFSFAIPRPVMVYCCVLLCLGLLPLRVLFINISADPVLVTESAKTMILAESRGMIYDRNMVALVYDSKSTVSVVKPTPAAAAELKRVLPKADFELIKQELSYGNPLFIKIGNAVSCEDILSVPIYKRYNNLSVATHVIGYLDSGEVNGISGIEKSFNDFLTENSGNLSVRFFTDANGRFLPGAETEIVSRNYMSKAGVVLTIDKKFQQALEKAVDVSGIEKGTAVMLEADSGAIVAMLSRPDFNRSEISALLNDENRALFNRVLGVYPVGSAFKPLVAATAVDCGINPTAEYFCNGETTAGGVSFHCTKKHGKVNMASALAYSCNCYFVNLIEEIGCEVCLNACDAVGFGKSIELADGITCYSGNLPDVRSLDSAAARALFSFGQGELSANIIQVASLYATIATGGSCYQPYLVKGLVDENGEYLSEHACKPPYNVFSSYAASCISDFLELAVREGTGKAAQVDGIRVCGKTATAQTGEMINGRERLVTWFVGFYPYEAPEYVIAVMCEDGAAGGVDCAPAFAKAISEILNNN